MLGGITKRYQIDDIQSGVRPFIAVCSKVCLEKSNLTFLSQSALPHNNSLSLRDHCRSFHENNFRLFTVTKQPESRLWRARTTFAIESTFPKCRRAPFDKTFPRVFVYSRWPWPLARHVQRLSSVLSLKTGKA